MSNDAEDFADVDAELLAAEVEEKPTKAQLRWAQKANAERLPENPAAALQVLKQQHSEKAEPMTNTNEAPISHEQQKAIIETKTVMAQMEEVMREIGQIEAFDFINKLTTVSSLKILQKIKETKSYKGLVYQTTDGKLLTVSSWDDFCTHKLNTPRPTIDERLINLNQLGESFFEASQKIGLGYRELRKLRQLPEDQQQLVIENEAVDLGDKEALRELIDELNAKHQKELKAARGEKEELDKSLKVARQMRDEAQGEANKFREQIAARQFNPDAWKSDVSAIVLSMAKLEGEILQRLTQLAAIREKIANLDTDESLAKDAATYQAAMSYLAGTLLHSSRSVAEDAASFWQSVDLQFAGFADKARPSVSVLEELANSALGQEA